MTISAYAIPGLKPELGPIKFDEIKMDDIAYKICTYFGFPIESVKNKNNETSVVYVRDWCMWFCIFFSGNSLKKIGRFFGMKDHTATMYSREKIHAILKDIKHPLHDKYKSDYDNLLKIFN